MKPSEAIKVLFDTVQNAANLPFSFNVLNEAFSAIEPICNAEDQPIGGNWPLYRCIKQVRALQIESIEGCTLHCKGGIAVEKDEDWMLKHEPEPDGYLVRYADGYESYSPQQPFETGYIPC